MNKEKVNFKYYRRELGTGVLVRVDHDKARLEYLTPECEWILDDQGWYVDMFWDEKVPYSEVSEVFVEQYIKSYLMEKNGLSYKLR